MEQTTQDAIETVDNARQHKCELEGRKKQLISAIDQVTNTADLTRHEVQQYFEIIQHKLKAAIEAHTKALLDEINDIEVKALEPLKDCQTLIEDGIEEASEVIHSGEIILSEDVDTEPKLEHVKKFISMTDSLTLDSVPEVPSAVEVPSLSVTFNSDFVGTIISAVRKEGIVNRRSPVQIVDLAPIPGGIVVSWAPTDEDDHHNFEKLTSVKHLYRLQSCRGKCTSISMNPMKNLTLFKEEYTGPQLSYAVKNLVANTTYTFRVCRCEFDEIQNIAKRWSPWSVYQEKMTIMPAFTWMKPKDENSYVLAEKNKIAMKKSSQVKVLYSEISSFLIGYPISFKIDVEGKARNRNDCIGLCTKRDPDATGMHTKEGTLCMMTDGHIWVNGVCSQTRFAKLCRGVVASFCLEQTDEKSSDSKHGLPGYRVTLTSGDHEAVFDWIPTKAGTFNAKNLAFFMLFYSSGWKISII